MGLLLAILFMLAPEQTSLLKTFRAEFIAITPGKGDFPRKFEMSDAKNPDAMREVTFDYEFSVAKYEVPQNLWTAVMGDNPSGWKGPRNSVEELSFDEAVSFCEKATKLMRDAKLIRPNEVIRLPSETEWEYFARAGTKTAYSFGDDPKELDEYAWSTQNAAGNDPPVGAKKPNPWGLYDVHGYLWEWCSPDKDAVKRGDKRRVLRGGSWKDRANKLTSSFRYVVSKDFRDDAVGLRCVLATVQKP